VGQPCAEADSSTADALVNCSPHCKLLHIQYLTEANICSSKIIITDLSDMFRHLIHMLLHNIVSELGYICSCSTVLSVTIDMLLCTITFVLYFRVTFGIPGIGNIKVIVMPFCVVDCFQHFE